jgi:uncharacterized protein (DUF362 family)
MCDKGAKMKKGEITRRDFMKVGAGAAAGLMTASFIGCSGGGGDSVSYETINSDWYYHGQLGITALFETNNRILYRDLLPEAFELPDSLQFLVSISHYHSVSFPLVPYHEGSVILNCKYRGKDGYYYLTMPVDNRLASDAGRSFGFPNYVADSVNLSKDGDVWLGHVHNQGRTVFRMEFRPKGGSDSRDNFNPGPTAYNLLPHGAVRSYPESCTSGNWIPTGVGPQVLDVKTSLHGIQQVTTTSGSVKVTVDDNEAWAGLMDGATPVSARLEEKRGNWTLVSGSEPTITAVSIARINDGRIDLAVEDAIGLLGGMEDLTACANKIMIKPNLVSDSASATTKPAVVGTVARLMQRYGKEVLIGEGSASCNNYNVINGVYYRTKKQSILDPMQAHIFDALGYTALAQSLNIPQSNLVNLHSGPMSSVPITNGLIYNNISLHHTLTEIDMLCSVPMMKTHNLGQVTLGMKNLIGLYPGTVYGSLRHLVHDQGVNLESSAVAGIVVDMVRANKLGLVVVDASTAMEGNGPVGGNLVQMNLIIAGTNALATDMVAAYIMGFSPAEVPTFLYANQVGMQPQRLTQIEVRGVSMESVRRNFVRPNIQPWNAVAQTIGGLEI